jgi:hypothetical protein
MAASTRNASPVSPAAAKPPKAKRPSKAVCPMVPGRAYAFKFPRHNFHGVISRMEQRRILVERVRDLTKEPIDRVSFDLQPLLRRGRFLVTGLDLDINEERSFYTASMSEILEIDPAMTERKPITIWIVEGQPFASLACAMVTAEVSANHGRKPVEIERAEIPVNLTRRTVRVVEPKAE